MTYEQIAEYVRNNWNLDQYFDPQDLVDDVRRTFQREGSYFPNESIKYIREAWRENITGIQQEGLDYYDTVPQRETLDDIRADYRNRFSKFFEETEIPEGHDVEETLATPPPVIEQLPPVDVTPERQSWFTGGFRSLGNRIWKLLGR